MPGGHLYRFVVDQNVKGPIGREVEVRAAQRLVDATDKPIVHDEALGVLATLNGAELTTESCLLSDPGTLLATSDEPRGNGIRVVVGPGDPRARPRVLDPAAPAPAGRAGRPG